MKVGPFTAVASLVTLTVSLWAGATQAQVLRGSFAGITASNLTQNPSTPFSGGFRLDVSGAEYLFEDERGWSTWNVFGDTSIDIAIAGRNLAFGVGTLDWLHLRNDTDRQELLLQVGEYGNSAWLLLVGPRNAFVDGIDLSTLRGGPVLLDSSLVAWAGRVTGWDGVPSSLHFDTPAAPVPEPAVAWLLAVGLAATAWQRRRQQQRATDPGSPA